MALRAGAFSPVTGMPCMGTWGARPGVRVRGWGAGGAASTPPACGSGRRRWRHVVPIRCHRLLVVEAS